MSKILFGVALLSALAGGVFWITQKSPTGNALCPDCNVVLISIDTLGAKHTSVYDKTLNTTPFLKKITDERGVVFDHAITQSSWTLPSHTSMLFGHYPWQVGVWVPFDVVPASLTSIAEVLKKNGYRTGAFSIGAFVQPEWGFTQGFDTFEGTRKKEAWNDSPKIFTDAAAWAIERDEPFFLFVRSFHVHDPYIPKNDSDSIDIGEVVELNLKDGGPTEADAARLRALYHKEVQEIDMGLEALFTAFDEAGLMDSTLFIITADHGEEFNEHGTVGMHGTSLYTELIHVPLIVVAPELSPRRIGGTVEVRSIPQTILSALSIRNSTVPGSSLTPFITGEKNESTTIALSAMSGSREALLQTIEKAYANNETDYLKDLLAVRQEDFKGQETWSALRFPYHYMRVAETEFLFNLATDPSEKKNLIAQNGTLPPDEHVQILLLRNAINEAQ